MILEIIESFHLHLYCPVKHDLSSLFLSPWLLLHSRTNRAQQAVREVGWAGPRGRGTGMGTSLLLLASWDLVMKVVGSTLARALVTSRAPANPREPNSRVIHFWGSLLGAQCV